MNRLSIIVLLTAFVLCICSCGNRASKEFKAMEEEVVSIENQINTTTDCDDLQMLNFSILGLRSDLDNLIQAAEIPDEEISQLDEMLTRLEATWKIPMSCRLHFFWYFCTLKIFDYGILLST